MIWPALASSVNLSSLYSFTVDDNIEISLGISSVSQIQKIKYSEPALASLASHSMLGGTLLRGKLME